MKKNYFLGTLMSLLMLVALPGQAQVNSMADLFGKYRFTADMKVEAAGEALKENFSNDCEVIINEDKNYEADVFGIAGAVYVKNAHKVFSIDLESNKLIMQSWNGNQGSGWDAGIWMSNKEGIYPFGWKEEHPKIEELVFSFDPTTKTITIPDFTLVTVDHAKATAVVLATFTNAKLTFVEPIVVEKVEWEGIYKVTADVQWRMNGATEENTPAEFDMEIGYSETAGAYMIRSFMGQNLLAANMSVKLNPTDKANVLKTDKLPVVGFEGNYEAFYKLKSTNGEAIEITLTKNEDGSITITEFSVYAGAYDNTDSDKYYAVYNSVTAKLPVKDYDWTGVYSVTAADLTLENGAELPAKFEMTIIKENDKYYVQNVFGTDIKTLNTGMGTTALTISPENPMEATLNAGLFLMDLGEGAFYQMYDIEGTLNPISFKANEDGSINIGDFCVMKMDWGKGTLDKAATYKEVVATTATEDGISSVGQTATTGGKTYDLSGRIVKKAQKGIFIQNGKKFIVK